MRQHEQAGDCTHREDDSLYPIDEEPRQVRVGHPIGHGTAQILDRPDRDSDYGDDDCRFADPQREVFYVSDHGDGNQNRPHDTQHSVDLVVGRRALLNETDAVDEHSDT